MSLIKVESIFSFWLEFNFSVSKYVLLFSFTKRNTKPFCCHSTKNSDILAFSQTSYFFLILFSKLGFPLRWTFLLLLISLFLCFPFFLPGINYFTFKAVQSNPTVAIIPVHHGNVDSWFTKQLKHLPLTICIF